MANLNILASDIDINFEKNAFSRDITVLEGEQAIRRALKNLFFLKPYEKPFHPEIDCGISSLLFENANPVVISEAKSRIKRAIARFEPRVMNSDVTLEYNDDSKVLVVKVLYTIRNIKKVFTTTVTLERIR